MNVQNIRSKQIIYYLSFSLQTSLNLPLLIIFVPASNNFFIIFTEMNSDRNNSMSFHHQVLNGKFQLKTHRSMDGTSQMGSTLISTKISDLRDRETYKENQLSLSKNLQKCLKQGFGKKKIGQLTSRGSCQELLSRANSQVYKLSESNRLKSQNKIKNEQMCFRIKLKMITLMRKLNIKNEEVEKFQNLEPEQFILNFYNRMTTYYKDNQQEVKKLREKCQITLQSLKQKNEEINKQNQKYKQIKQENNKYIKQIKQQNKVISLKEKQIENLLFQLQSLNKKIQQLENDEKCKNVEQQELLSTISSISGQSYRRQIQISELEKLLASKKQENCYLRQKLTLLQHQGSQQNQQVNKQQVDARRNQFTEKMKMIVDQWKNHLQNTVNSYEKMVDQYCCEINKKDEQIKYLKLIVLNYRQNK